MPDQKFTDPATGDEVVSIHWDLGMTSIDVAFGGSLLTKISDVGTLRSTGMGGVAPDGSTVTIKLGFGDAFEVTRNGEPLNASQVNMFANLFSTGSLLSSGQDGPAKVTMDSAGRLLQGSTVLDDGSKPQPGGRFGPMAVAALEKARGWLLFFGIYHAFSLVVIGIVMFFIFKVGSAADGPLPAWTYALGAGVTAAFCLVPLSLCVASFKLRAMAGTRKARKAMRISKWIAGVFCVLALLGMAFSVKAAGPLGVLNGVIPLIVYWSSFQAFSMAENLSPHE